MATRDFKIRTGLVVTGNTEIQGSITVGGNTYSKLLDSDNITNIINNTVTGLADSDLKAIADIRNDVDSDSIAIQAIQTDLETAESNITTIQSDISTINAKLDSDSIKIQVLQGEVDALTAGTYNDAPLVARLDSDSIKIQAIQTQLDALDTGDIAALRADADSDTIAIQSIRTSVDSDYALFNTKIALFNGLTDSDLTAVSNLRNDVDSDSIKIQAIQTQVNTLPTSSFDSDQIVGIINENVVTDPTINTRLDSDEIKIQALGTSIESLNTTLTGLSGSAAIQTVVYTFTATQGQTAFTGTDDNGLTLSYAPGYIYVFVNGVLVLDTTDYTATDGSTVNIIEALDSDNTVQIIKHVGTVQAGFDSEGIVNIINENVITDPTVNTRLDSDSLAIQALSTSIGNINSNIGSSNNDGAGETQQVFDSFATGDYRSVKYFVSASSNDSSWFASEIIIIHDGTNAYLTEYGTISTHDSEFITFDADVNGGNVRLLGTPSNSLTNVKTVRQHIIQ